MNLSRLFLLSIFCLSTFTVNAQSNTAPVTSSEQAARDKMLADMKGALQNCGKAINAQTLDSKAFNAKAVNTCEASLSTIVEIQPTIQFIHEAMISYYIEVVIRDNLVNQYLKASNLNKLCENAEKMWFARDRASQYSDHPVFNELSQVAMGKLRDVKTCRKMGGTPKWGAPIK